MAVFLLSCWGAFAQPGEVDVVVRNGQKFYVHVVQQGNTLWGLHNLYKVEVADIVAANPGVENSLPVGAMVYIPVSGQVDVQPASSESKHVVKQGETLYGISREHGTTVEELTKLNPGVENGLSIGMVLNLPAKEQVGQATEINLHPEPQEPAYEVSVSDSTVKHEVKRGETLYSISRRFLLTVDDLIKANPVLNHKKLKRGDILVIPLKQVDLRPVEREVPEVGMDSLANVATGVPQKKQTYKVALLMPFMLHRNQALISGSYVQRPDISGTTRNAISFYQGFKLAMDSLTRAGFNVELMVHDTRNDSLATARVLKGLESNMPDLIVGPVLPKRVAQVNAFSKEHGVMMVLPFKSKSSVTQGNPNAVQAITPNDIQLAYLGRWLAIEHGRHNVLMIDSKKSKDRPLMDLVSREYSNAISQVPGAMRSSLKEVGMGSSAGRDLLPHLRRDTLNVLVVPTLNEAVANDLFRRLSNVRDRSGGWDDVQIMVVGGTAWSGFNSLKTEQLVESKVTYPSVNNLDYDLSSTKDFIRQFRKEYNVDPTAVASQGFDVGMFFGAGLLMFGTHNQRVISAVEVPLVQNDFQLKYDPATSNWVNAHVMILQYQGYNLREVR